MTYGSFLCPPQIHLEQEDPFNLDNDMNRNTGISNATGNNRQLMAAEWRDLFNDPALWEQAPPPYYNHL